MRHHDTHQGSANFHTHTVGADTGLPPHLQPAPTQTQLGLSPIGYFEASVSYPFTQHSSSPSYAPPQLSTLYNNPSQPSTRISNTPEYPSPSQDSAYYVPEPSYYRTEVSDRQGDLIAIGSQFGAQGNADHDHPMEIGHGQGS